MSASDERYNVEVLKKLEAFKSAVEWSDFIGLLGALDQTLKRYKTNYIPHKALLIKRLNQCLNPVLPAGVHLKTIETYCLIFDKLPQNELISDFSFITIGLSKFALDCRILVITEYLDLLQKYIIPLGSQIEKHSKSVIVSLLPSLESESSEFFNRSYLLLLDYSNSIDTRIFFDTLWAIFLEYESLRTSIINFVVKSKTLQVADYKILTKAFCVAFESPNPYVVRTMLDFSNRNFPFSINESAKDGFNKGVIKDGQYVSNDKKQLKEDILNREGISSQYTMNEKKQVNNEPLNKDGLSSQYTINEKKQVNNDPENMASQYTLNEKKQNSADPLNTFNNNLNASMGNITQQSINDKKQNINDRKMKTDDLLSTFNKSNLSLATSMTETTVNVEVQKPNGFIKAYQPINIDDLPQETREALIKEMTPFNVQLLKSVLKIFLKKEAGINKRAYKWLNIYDSFTVKDIKYLETGLRAYLYSTEENLLMFFKILFSLADKEDLISQLMDNMILDALAQLYEIESKTPNSMAKFSKWFSMLGLDDTWRIFYLKLKEAFEEEKRVSSRSVIKAEPSMMYNPNTGETLYPESEITEIKNFTSNKIIKMIIFSVNSFDIIDDQVRSIHLPALAILIAKNKRRVNGLAFEEFMNIFIENSTVGENFEMIKNEDISIKENNISSDLQHRNDDKGIKENTSDRDLTVNKGNIKENAKLQENIDDNSKIQENIDGNSKVMKNIDDKDLLLKNDLKFNKSKENKDLKFSKSMEEYRVKYGKVQETIDKAYVNESFKDISNLNLIAAVAYELGNIDIYSRSPVRLQVFKGSDLVEIDGVLEYKETYITKGKFSKNKDSCVSEDELLDQIAFTPGDLKIIQKFINKFGLIFNDSFTGKLCEFLVKNYKFIGLVKILKNRINKEELFENLWSDFIEYKSPSHLLFYDAQEFVNSKMPYCSIDDIQRLLKYTLKHSQYLDTFFYFSSTIDHSSEKYLSIVYSIDRTEPVLEYLVNKFTDCDVETENFKYLGNPDLNRIKSILEIMRDLCGNESFRKVLLGNKTVNTKAYGEITALETVCKMLFHLITSELSEDCKNSEVDDLKQVDSNCNVLNGDIKGGKVLADDANSKETKIQNVDNSSKDDAGNGENGLEDDQDDSKLNDSKLNDSKLNDIKLNESKMNDNKSNDSKSISKSNVSKINHFVNTDDSKQEHPPMLENMKKYSLAVNYSIIQRIAFDIIYILNNYSIPVNFDDLGPIKYIIKKNYKDYYIVKRCLFLFKNSIGFITSNCLYNFREAISDLCAMEIKDTFLKSVLNKSDRYSLEFIECIFSHLNNIDKFNWSSFYSHAVTSMIDRCREIGLKYIKINDEYLWAKRLEEESSDEIDGEEQKHSKMYRNNIHASNLFKDDIHANNSHENNIRANNVHENNLHKNDMHKNDMRENYIHKDNMHKNSEISVHANFTHGNGNGSNNENGDKNERLILNNTFYCESLSSEEAKALYPELSETIFIFSKDTSGIEEFASKLYHKDPTMFSSTIFTAKHSDWLFFLLPFKKDVFRKIMSKEYTASTHAAGLLKYTKCLPLNLRQEIFKAESDFLKNNFGYLKIDQLSSIFVLEFLNGLKYSESMRIILGNILYNLESKISADIKSDASLESNIKILRFFLSLDVSDQNVLNSYKNCVFAILGSKNNKEDALIIIEEFIKLKKNNKIFIDSFINYFNGDFFDCNLEMKMDIMKHIMKLNSVDFIAVFNALFEGLDGSYFMSVQNSTNQKVMALKRMIFLILCNENDGFISVVDKIISSINTLLSAPSEVKIYVYRLCTAMVIKIDNKFIQHLYPILLEDIIKSVTNSRFDVAESVFEFVDICIWNKSQVMSFTPLIIEENEFSTQLRNSYDANKAQKSEINYDSRKCVNLFKQTRDIGVYLREAPKYYDWASRNFVENDYDRIELDLLRVLSEN